MNVLSLFDGISCCQLALNRSGINIGSYFSSEINKRSIQVTDKHFPNTTQLGDIQAIKYRELPQIDLIVGGSPCQGFSTLGNRLNFKDDRSKLFFEYLKLLEEINPKYFIFENVRMKKEISDHISSYLGVPYISLDSKYVSAQYRNRLYWTNIPNVSIPEDKGVLFKDIIDLDVKTYRYLKSYQMDKFLNREYKWELVYRLVSNYGKLQAITHRGSSISSNKVWHIKGKLLRYLTNIEMERAQTLPDNYTYGFSYAQRRKMIGNAFTVDIISHILSHIPT